MSANARAAGLRRLTAWANREVALPEPAASGPRCELCPLSLATDHRHLLHLTERRIVCVCEGCWAVHSGDPEYRPTGTRVLELSGFDMTDDLWAWFAIPVGLAFFLRVGGEDRVVALYPSPAGATECELDMPAWEALRERNPVLERLEPDCEALLVNRLTDPPRYAIVPTDECYRLVGMIKARWDGISGGAAVESAVAEFFDGLRELVPR